jgi:hypothetical protein
MGRGRVFRNSNPAYVFGAPRLRHAGPWGAARWLHAAAANSKTRTPMINQPPRIDLKDLPNSVLLTKIAPALLRLDQIH